MLVCLFAAVVLRCEGSLDVCCGRRFWICRCRYRYAVRYTSEADMSLNGWMDVRYEPFIVVAFVIVEAFVPFVVFSVKPKTEPTNLPVNHSSHKIDRQTATFPLWKWAFS